MFAGTIIALLNRRELQIHFAAKRCVIHLERMRYV